MGKKTMISLRKRVALVIGLLLSLSLMAFSGLPAAAQEISPDHLKLARQYVDMTDKAGIYEGTLVQTAIHTAQTILTQNPGLSTPINTAIEKVLADYKTRKGELFDQFARVYALNFSVDELKQIIAFYQTDVGKKLTASNRSINGDLQKVMQLFDANLQPEFYAKVRAELKSAGYSV
ncbi:MAG: hypothetical protein JWN11_2224 [Hyphomicrobiales bacterium]|jgi:hypothetical protein|nr:hypothetical protein [Hyphomicrobiales bacterium]